MPLKKSLSLFGLSLAGSLFTIGCSSDAELMTVMQRLPVGRAAQSVRRAVTDQSSAVTIDSMKVPVYEIALARGESLFGAETPWTLYTCSGATEADCLVDLASPGTNQLVSGEIRSSLPPGTYTSLMVSYCKDAAAVALNKYNMKVKARIFVGGESLFTKTGSPQLATTIAEYGPLDLTFSNCRTYYVLNQPLVLAGDEEITFGIFNDLRATSTVYRFASNMSILSGVTCSANGKPYICVHPPNFFVTTDGSTPTVERYRLRNTSAPDEADKVLGLAFGQNDKPIGGYVRAYLDGTQDPTTYVPFPGEIKSVSKVDQKLQLTDFWDSGTENNFSKIASPGNFTVKDFPRSQVGAGPSPVVYEDHLRVVQSAPVFTVERMD